MKLVFEASIAIPATSTVACFDKDHCFASDELIARFSRHPTEEASTILSTDVYLTRFCIESSTRLLPAYDLDIVQSLCVEQESYLLTPQNFRALVNSQLHTRDGFLLDDRSYTICYMMDNHGMYVVSTRYLKTSACSSNHQKWDLHVWNPGPGFWKNGTRVVCRTQTPG